VLHISVHSGFKLAMLSEMVSANRSDASAWKRASLRRNCRLGCVCSSMYGRCVQSVVGQEREIVCMGAAAMLTISVHLATCLLHHLLVKNMHAQRLSLTACEERQWSAASYCCGGCCCSCSR
jgi:hypothetical protein